MDAINHTLGNIEKAQIRISTYNMIEEKKLEDKIELKASFCLGHCSEGVSMLVDGEPLQNVNPENVESVFNEQIVTKI